MEIYHLKVSGKANWPKMAEAIARIDRARARGQDVTADMYPYLAGGTGLSSVFPPSLAADGKFYENLRDPAIRARVKEEVLQPSGGWEALGTLAGPEGIFPLDFNRAGEPAIRRQVPGRDRGSCRARTGSIPPPICLSPRSSASAPCTS